MNCEKCGNLNIIGDELTGQLVCNICDNKCSKCGTSDVKGEWCCKLCDTRYTINNIEYDKETFSDESEKMSNKMCYYI
jgi:hypothetical protein